MKLAIPSLVVLALTACGSEEGLKSLTNGEPVPAAPVTETAPSEPPPGPSAGETATGTVPEPPGPSGGSTSSSGGTAPGDRRLFPAADLRQWNYEGFSTTRGITTPVFYNYMILGVLEEDGHDVYVVTSNYNGQRASNHTWTPSNDDVLQRYGFDPTWYPLLRGPAVDGASWSFVTSDRAHVTSTWRRVGPTTVRAGTFDDCWRVDTSVAETTRIGDVSYMIACRGIGNVKVSQRLWNGYVLEYELVSKNF